jgi:AraC-like DNA-binding protein
MSRYPQIVDHFVRIARANFGNVVRVDDLCRLAGANPRTISRAFKVVHDTTPSCYLRELRLMEVRSVLLSGRNRASITQVATRFGFRELGRFSVLYRSRFGEAPSVTNDLSISRHEPHDATQGGGPGGISLMSNVRQRSVSHAQTTNTKHTRQDEYLQSDKRRVSRAPQCHKLLTYTKIVRKCIAKSDA